MTDEPVRSDVVDELEQITGDLEATLRELQRVVAAERQRVHDLYGERRPGV